MNILKKQVNSTILDFKGSMGELIAISFATIVSSLLLSFIFLICLTKTPLAQVGQIFVINA